MLWRQSRKVSASWHVFCALITLGTIKYNKTLASFDPEVAQRRSDEYLKAERLAFGTHHVVTSTFGIHREPRGSSDATSYGLAVGACQMQRRSHALAARS